MRFSVPSVVIIFDREIETIEDTEKLPQAHLTEHVCVSHDYSLQLVRKLLSRHYAGAVAPGNLAGTDNRGSGISDQEPGLSARHASARRPKWKWLTGV